MCFFEYRVFEKSFYTFEKLLKENKVVYLRFCREEREKWEGGVILIYFFISSFFLLRSDVRTKLQTQDVLSILRKITMHF